MTKQPLSGFFSFLNRPGPATDVSSATASYVARIENYIGEKIVGQLMSSEGKKLYFDQLLQAANLDRDEAKYVLTEYLVPTGAVSIQKPESALSDEHFLVTLSESLDKAG